MFTSGGEEGKGERRGKFFRRKRLIYEGKRGESEPWCVEVLDLCLTVACHCGILADGKGVRTMSKPNRGRDTLISIRTTPDIKAALVELVGLMGEELGTKITQAQVLEILVSEALRARTVGTDD